jgi:RNA polymerase sigma-70 factor (ECF subfamily)
MSTEKKLKKAVRERIALTGEPFSIAKAKVESSQGSPAQQAISEKQRELNAAVLLSHIVPRPGLADTWRDARGLTFRSVTPQEQGVELRIGRDELITFLRLMRTGPMGLVPRLNGEGLVLLHPMDPEAFVRLTLVYGRRRVDLNRIVDEAAGIQPGSPVEPLHVHPGIVRHYLPTDPIAFTYTVASDLLLHSHPLRTADAGAWVTTIKPSPSGFGPAHWLRPEIPSAYAGVLPWSGQERSEAQQIVSYVLAVAEQPPVSLIFTAASPTAEPPPEPLIYDITMPHWADLQRHDEVLWYENLVQHFGPRLVPTLYRVFGGNLRDAKEIASDTLGLAWARRSRIVGDPGPWLFTAAKYLSMNRLRANRRHPVDPLNQSDHLEIASGDDFSEAIAVRMALGQAMKSLTEEDRFILWAHIVDGVSSAEIGGWLGISATAVRTRQHRAIVKLKQLLEEGDIQ